MATGRRERRRGLHAAASASHVCTLGDACGTGVVTQLAAERTGSAGRVVGLEINVVMLGIARRMLETGFPPGCA